MKTFTYRKIAACTLILVVVVVILYTRQQKTIYRIERVLSLPDPQTWPMLSLHQVIATFKRRSGFHGNDALNDYCNSPSKKTTGNEGRYLDDFKLKMVHVFIRHGERTSARGFFGNNPRNYNCNFSTWYNGSNEKFRAFPERMDQMSRTQKLFQRLSPYPNQSTCLSYILTSRGALQQMQLGQHLYDSYSKHLHLFDKTETLSNQMKIKSTRYSRTYQSAIALLYGFLPVFDNSSLDLQFATNVHFCTENLTLNRTCKCPRANRLHVCSVLYQRAKHKNDSSHSQLRKHISAISGLSENDSGLLSGIADSVIPMYCNNFTLPCSKFNSLDCVNTALLDAVWDANMDIEFSNWDDPDLNKLKYSSITMTPVLLEIVQNMKDRIQNKIRERIFLYSGHDITLSPLLYVLGLHDGRWTPFASRVAIELYKKLNVQNVDTFYLKILYNGVDKTDDVIFCKNRTVDGYCDFELFSEFVTSRLLTRFGYAYYSDACLGKLDNLDC